MSLEFGLKAAFQGVRLATLAFVLPALAAFAQEDTGAEPFAFDVGAINQGLPPVEPPLRLDTPRAALESFFDAVVEVSDEAAILWIWISGSTPATAWDLHNEVREKMMRFLADFEDGAYLPRQRQAILWDQNPGPGPSMASSAPSRQA